MFFAAKTKKDRYRWCNYKLNDKKTAQITYLKLKKQQTRFRLNYSEVLKEEKRYNSCFESQKTTGKVNATVVAVIKKARRSAWCI